MSWINYHNKFHEQPSSLKITEIKKLNSNFIITSNNKNMSIEELLDEVGKSSKDAQTFEKTFESRNIFIFSLFPFSNSTVITYKGSSFKTTFPLIDNRTSYSNR